MAEIAAVDDVDVVGPVDTDKMHFGNNECRIRGLVIPIPFPTPIPTSGFTTLTGDRVGTGIGIISSTSSDSGSGSDSDSDSTHALGGITDSCSDISTLSGATVSNSSNLTTCGSKSRLSVTSVVTITTSFSSLWTRVSKLLEASGTFVLIPDPLRKNGFDSNGTGTTLFLLAATTGGGGVDFDFDFDFSAFVLDDVD
ncbi:hypothetical protein LXL04_021777 [Taraxacum kok-saghyz]